MNAVLPAPFLAAHNSLLAELYVQAKASRWSLSREEFNAALYRSVVHRFGALLPREYTVEFYLRSLHLEDFAFACALHRGTAWAWEQFFGHYRPSLYSDSAAMAGSQGEAYARGLVDAFYDELHPVGPDGDEPDRSGLRDYHGRSKLATWLRFSIAERRVDSTALSGARETEAARRIKKPAGPPGSLGSSTSSRHFRSIRQPLASFDPLRAPYLAALRQAFDDAIAALAASDRLFAALCCAEQLDRSQMAQLQGVPEITISRRLADIRGELHTAIAGILASTTVSTRAPEDDEVACALTPAQIDRCFTYAFEDWQSEIHAPPAKSGLLRAKASLLEAKISVLRDLPQRRDKKSGGKESPKERDEVFAWLLANSLKRRAANIVSSNPPGCPEAELLSAYADRALDPDETARWELHFADCARCRAILAAYMAPAKQPAAQREPVYSSSASVHANVPGTNIPEIGVAASAILPAANSRPNRSARLVSRFAWRWIAPVVMLAIGAAIGFALHPLTPQVASRFPQRVEPDDYPVPDDSQSVGTLTGPFGSPGPAPFIYETGTGSDADSSATVTISNGESNWEKNRFVQIASREFMKAFTQTEKLIEWLTVPPSALARAARARPANQSARAANSSSSRAASRGSSRPASRAAEASSLGSALPVVFASPDAKTLWRIGPAGRIAYSADRGAHWQIQASGVDADLFTGAATPDNAVWVLGRGGVILRTTDGTQWRTVSNPSSFSSGLSSGAPLGARAGARPEWIRIVAADKLHATVTAADSRKFSTSNGGATWVAAP